MTQTNAQRPAWGKALVLGFLLAALLAMSLLLAASKPAPAATTFTVTSTADPGNGVCDVVCTLREAITAANNTPGEDTINFRLSNTGGVRTILPTSELPEITEAVTIDGYTQLGSSPNTLSKLSEGTNAVLRVELDGSNAGSEVSGLVISGADDVVVRGLVINRFDFNGIRIRSGFSSNVRIEGNFLGTDPSGTLDLGNSGNGVSLNGDSNVVGGGSPDDRNLISGNEFDGVGMLFARDTRVEGNLIGTNKNGTSALGNNDDGVDIVSSEDGFVGGFSPSAANTIAFNGDEGVEIARSDSGDDPSGNQVLSNSIFANGGLGIDLDGGTENAAEATKNDLGDADAGANNLQNKPVLTSAKTASGKTTIQGKLNSTSRDPFVIQFFSNPPGDEDGKKFIGDKSVSTNSSGNVTFTFTPSQAVTAGQTVTATATNSVEANTSEFSAQRKVVAS